MSDINLGDDRAAVRAGWTKAIASARETLLRHAIVEVKACSEGWIDSGLDLESGDRVSLLAVGEVRLSETPDIRFPANLGLWRRIGADGRVARSSSVTTTFEAAAAGRLFLIAKYPGEWATENGAFDPGWPRAGATGSLTVAVLVWRNTAAEGLALFATHDASELAANEASRLAADKKAPRGWRPLWRVGETQIFCEETGAGESAHIGCRCSWDAGILRYPVAFPLDETARLAWAWRVARLPSEVAEDTVPTHDYLSIAVEFDNGLDLTYMWSAALAVGKVFACPLPWWDKRETHMVVRSGLSELGRWIDEERPILSDYAAAIGGPAPARIVGVWLIALSCFQRGFGSCDYARIALRGAKGQALIGP
jgi:hypothetical protein